MDEQGNGVHSGESKKERLQSIDLALRRIHKFLLAEHQLTNVILESDLAAKNTPMVDYEIELQLDYLLPEDDPEYKEESDNVLARRSLFLTSEKTSWTDALASIDTDNYSTTEIAQGWLTHDVVEHAYPQSPAIGDEGLLRAKKVWVNFVVTKQYCFNLMAD
jgi:hypothetical protein